MQEERVRPIISTPWRVDRTVSRRTACDTRAAMKGAPLFIVAVLYWIIDLNCSLLCEKVRTSPLDRFDGRQQMFRRVVLRNKPPSAHLRCLHTYEVTLIDRDQNHPRGNGESINLLRCLKPIHFRQMNSHHQHVRLKSFDSFHSVLAVIGFSNQLNIFGYTQQQPERSSHLWVIFRNRNTYHDIFTLSKCISKLTCRCTMFESPAKRPLTPIKL